MKTSRPVSNKPRFIVVIGASAGGLTALIEMIAGLEKGLDVAYCIVLHLSRKGIGDFVVHKLKLVTSMVCRLATKGELLLKDHVYIAQPNQHMLVKNGSIVLGNGPEENRFRPSIDVLFRSAAVAYSTHAIGVILSGLLDDGTSGMWAIKRSNGACIVQDPNQAEYPDMPLSVINNMDVDYVVPLHDIGKTIALIVAQRKRKKFAAVPKELIAESIIAENTAIGIEAIEKIADTSVFACPDCGGNLWSVTGDIITRYRCHIGHAYSEKDLVVKQAETAGATLWVALRMMEERKHLLKKMEISSIQKGHKSLSSMHAENQETMERHITTLKKILSELQNQEET